MNESEEKKRSYRLILYVALVLAVLTAIEYVVAIAIISNAIWLALIALAKSAFVVYFFMHVYRLWRTEIH